MSFKKILILTLTAGGGHIQAAKAKRLETRATYKDASIFEEDILFDWVFKYFGLFAKHLWGDAQAQGNTFLLIMLSFGLRIADYMLWVPFFFSALNTCLKHDVDKIIDTQPLATSAVIKALRIIKWWKGKEIVYEKVITDLPTKEAAHFFSGIKWLRSKDWPFIKVLTTKPILGKNETEQEFWKTQCNLPMSSIVYAPFPLRPAFFEYKKETYTSTFVLDIPIQSPEDLHLTYKTLSYGSVEAKRSKHLISIPIHPDDRVALMMLGANPTPKTIMTYTAHFIRSLKERKATSRKDLFFIFCSTQIIIKPNLRKQILTLVEQTKNYPKDLTIIPISHQNDQIVAPLLHRSNVALTRSGGLTSMELLTVSQGQIWIHQEPNCLPKFFPKIERFSYGMPPWERGNARYLELQKGARLITPDTFSQISAPYFA